MSNAPFEIASPPNISCVELVCEHDWFEVTQMKEFKHKASTHILRQVQVNTTAVIHF